MKKLLLLILLSSSTSLFTMPSASRHRFSYYAHGGGTFTSSTFINYHFAQSSDDYTYGPVFLTGLEYNSHNRLALGFETGYYNIGYGENRIHLIPWGLNFWNDDFSFQQGEVVLRIGLNLSHILTFNNPEHGLAFGPQLSLCYELNDKLYLTGTAKYLCLNLNDERYTHGTALIPLLCGVLYRL